MEHNKYPIPDEILTDTIEALRNLQTRLEVEAAALAKLPAAHSLAQKRLRDAERAERLFQFYLNL